MADEGSKLHVDSDWKSQAQAERERLRQKEEEKKQSQQAAEAQAAAVSSGPSAAQQDQQAQQAQAGPRETPQASFGTMVNSFATQALLYMGLIADPRTGQRMQNIDLARYQIDMLSILEEKCKGNLTKEENDQLAATLYELRLQYVQVTAAMRQKG